MSVCVSPYPPQNPPRGELGVIGVGIKVKALEYWNIVLVNLF